MSPTMCPRVAADRAPPAPGDDDRRGDTDQVRQSVEVNNQRADAETVDRRAGNTRRQGYCHRPERSAETRSTRTGPGGDTRARSATSLGTCVGGRHRTGSHRDRLVRRRVGRRAVGQAWPAGTPPTRRRFPSRATRRRVRRGRRDAPSAAPWPAAPLRGSFWTSASIAAWVASANGRLDNAAPSPPRNTEPPAGYPIGPSVSDRPNSRTILVARSVALARSLAAPVDPWPSATSSAARPPSRTARVSCR